jgi:L-threonylcarbamoyladenylate synthase
MKVVKIDLKRPSLKLIKDAAAVIRAGGVVAFPTETSYGLAADPASSEAVRRIFEIKGRPEEKPLSLIAADEMAVRRAFAVPDSMARFAARWPAALTLVLRRLPGQKLPALRGRSTGAVRVPGFRLARRLAALSGGLITATSANLSGTPDIYSGADLRWKFAGRDALPDMLLDGGPLPECLPSTIVSWRGGRPVVLRQGGEKI